MRRLEIFNKDELRVYYLPDSIRVNKADNGQAFNTLGDDPHTILWLPYSWGYVWIDELSA